jgi:hypothetical protein
MTSNQVEEIKENLSNGDVLRHVMKTNLFSIKASVRIMGR